jgi:hypothetical protein
MISGKKCIVCRQAYDLTKHHLIPKVRFDTERKRAGRIVILCRLCHKAVHLLFTNRQLVLHHYTKGRLRLQATKIIGMKYRLIFKEGHNDWQ